MRKVLKPAIFGAFGGNGPSRLPNGERTGHYWVAANGKLDDVGSVARADPAGFVPRQLSSGEYVRHTPASAF